MLCWKIFALHFDMPTGWTKTRNTAAEGVAAEGFLLFSDSIRGLEGEDSRCAQHTGTTQTEQEQSHRRDPHQLEFDDNEMEFEDDASLCGDGDFGCKEFAVSTELGGFDDEELSEFDAFDNDSASDYSGDRGTYTEGSASFGFPGVPPVYNDIDDVYPKGISHSHDDQDADADFLMGAVMMGIADRLLHLRGPYGAIPASKYWFEVSMMWRGDRFRRVYR